MMNWKLCFMVMLVFWLSLGTRDAFAQVPGSLYQQEGTATDGLAPINASGQGPAVHADSTNWIWQSGAESWSAVYGGEGGWITVSGAPAPLSIEADIELYCSVTTSDNKIYFHFGNIYTLTETDRTAYFETAVASNNGQWVGLDFTGTGKMPANFERLPMGGYTGRIFSLMHSDRTVDMMQHKDMDGEVKMNDGVSGYYRSPDSYGSNPQNTIHETLWWKVNNGVPGTYNLSWRIRMLPAAHQDDGDYYIDPRVVTSPVL